MALYERMLLIRRLEEKLSVDSAAGVLPGAVHLYIGQEAVATGVCMQLDRAAIMSTCEKWCLDVFVIVAVIVTVVVM